MTFLLRIILKRMSTEAYVYMRRRQSAKVKHFDLSNVIYHKFSHGAISYMLNVENVNVMLELSLSFYRYQFNFSRIITRKVIGACSLLVDRQLNKCVTRIRVLE